MTQDERDHYIELRQYLLRCGKDQEEAGRTYTANDYKQAAQAIRELLDRIPL